MRRSRPAKLERRHRHLRRPLRANKRQAGVAADADEEVAAVTLRLEARRRLQKRQPQLTPASSKAAVVVAAVAINLTGATTADRPADFPSRGAVAMVVAVATRLPSLRMRTPMQHRKRRR